MKSHHSYSEQFASGMIYFIKDSFNLRLHEKFILFPFYFGNLHHNCRPHGIPFFFTSLPGTHDPGYDLLSLQD